MSSELSAPERNPKNNRYEMDDIDTTMDDINFAPNTKGKEGSLGLSADEMNDLLGEDDGYHDDEWNKVDQTKLLKKEEEFIQNIIEKKKSTDEQSHDFDRNVLQPKSDFAEPSESVKYEISQDRSKTMEDEKSKKSRNRNAYENRLCKTVLKIGNKEIGLSTAKLYGLIDENGNIRKRPPEKTISINEKLEKVDELTKPYKMDETRIKQLQEHHTFKPSRSEEATKAMKNHRCGYDFLDRLDGRGGFLDRLNLDSGGKSGKIPQWQLDQMSEDYKASQDKLQCPQCKKPQSFDEFIEKRRVCGLCNKKFEKLNVTSGNRFYKKNQTHEERRQQKLREIEYEMYGKHASYQKNNITYKTMQPRATSATQRTKPTAKTSVLDGKNKTYKGPTMVYQQQGSHRAEDIVDNIVRQNNSQAKRLNQTLGEVFPQYQGTDYIDDEDGYAGSQGGNKRPPSGRSNSRPLSATTTGRFNNTNDRKSKFDKLVS